MALSSLRYLLAFLPLAYLAYRALPQRRRWPVLLAASYAFAWLSSGRLALYMAAASLVAYLGGLALNSLSARRAERHQGESREERKVRRARIDRQRKAVLAASAGVDLAILVVLKYGGFLAGILDGARSALGLSPLFGTATTVALPLGISFYTLMAVSYLVDVYRGKYPACRNLGTVALYVAFFPQLNEGPIGRFDQMANQLRAGALAHGPRLAYACQLIAWGLLKKVVVADRLNPLVGELFSNHASYQGVMVALAAVLYTLQLYADFSGVVDMARGTAELFGVTLAPNFRQPFFSRSVNEFWRRWHMSLGGWLRDYVFYPVSLSHLVRRLSKWARAHLSPHVAGLLVSLPSLLAVWMACGIWHGAAWKYLVYGLYYCAIVVAGMAAEPLFRRFFERTGINREGKGWRRFALVRTNVLVCLGMTLFRADDLPTFGSLCASLLAGPGLEPLATGTWLTHGTDALDLLVVAACAVAMLAVDHLHEQGHSLRPALTERGPWRAYAATAGLACAALVLGAYGAGYTVVPSIYAGF